jgi:trk system potassium uptake protein TrkH
MTRSFSAPQIIVLGFASVIALGAFLLALPIAHAAGGWMSPIDALFTATSAVCVTGLVVVDTGTFFSLFGQMVILVLIQIGGLGIVTVASLFLVGLGRQVAYSQRALITESLNLSTTGGVIRLLLGVLKLTLAIEATGAIALTLTWYKSMGWAKATYFGVFHAVSAFCNAGFDLFGEYRSLTGFVGSVPVNLVITGLIIAGGLGFPVLLDVGARLRGTHRRLQLHSKVVLFTTALLIVFAFGAFYLSEYNGVLQGLTLKEKLLGTYFQAITPRTAGFSTLGIGGLKTGTILMFIFLMFVGASSASTGGGIKTTTFASLLLATWSVVRGEDEVRFGSRSIDKSVVLKSLALVVLAMALVYTVTTLVSIVEPFAYEDVFFEVTSAFGTVGLSTGITPYLSPFSRVLLILTMYVGRVGPLTLMLAIAAGHKPQISRLPEGRIYVG